jgi:hypothetical protein
MQQRKPRFDLSPVIKYIVMKKLILFFAMALIGFSAIAQWGVKAGVNLSDVNGNEDAKMLAGFYGGFLYNARISEMFSFQPELVYSAQGAKISSTSENLRLSYLNLTPLFRYNTKSGFFAGTGPQIGFLLSAKDKAGGSSADVKEFFKDTDFSWAFALGYEIKSGFGFYGRYNLGISDIDNDSGIGTGTNGLRNSVLQFGFRYMLQKNKK